MIPSCKRNTFGTFLRTPDGYRVTNPEDLLQSVRSSIKLVDRLEFSRANFTADKNWEKGNPMRSENMKSFTSFITEAISASQFLNLLMTMRQMTMRTWSF